LALVAAEAAGAVLVSINTRASQPIESLAAALVLAEIKKAAGSGVT
jgi:hypothetical protein